MTRQSLAEAMSGRAFPVAFLAAIGLVLLWGWNMGETIFDTITWPVTHLVATVVLSERAIVIPWLVIALYAGELVWKDRETGAAQIADAGWLSRSMSPSSSSISGSGSTSIILSPRSVTKYARRWKRLSISSWSCRAFG